MQEKTKQAFWHVELWVNICLAFLLSFALIGKQFLIASALLGFLPVLWAIAKAVWQKRLSIDFLAGIALVASFLGREWHSAAFIGLMLAFARVFFLWTQAKEKKILDSLIKYQPKKIRVKQGDVIKEIDLSQVKKGDLVVVETGDFLPIDGVVVSGQAGVNEAMITGESEIKIKKPGDWVFSASVNESGSLIVRAEKIGDESFLAKMIILVEQASRKKAKSERVADKFTLWYVIGVLSVSFAVFLIFKNFQVSLAVLLVACADDIAVAIPLSFTLALSRAAKNGVLIKGGEVIEKAAKIKFFITDKTGTLTTGQPKIKDVIIFSPFSEKDILEKAGLAVSNSRHPASVALINFLKKEKGFSVLAPDSFLEFSGEGIEAKKNNDEILIGKMDFLQKRGIEIFTGQVNEITQEKEKGFSVMGVAINKKMAGVIVYEDELRPSAARLVREMKSLGVKSWTILTGDNENVAKKAAAQLDLTHFQANMKPQEKLEYIENFKAKKDGILAMIGDGVNDVAALAIADVSIAMAKAGADSAIEASDIALLNDKLENIPHAIVLCQKTMKIIYQHFWLWGALNLIGIGLVFAGVLDPTKAAAYNFATDFIPILNAFRLTRLGLKIPVRK
ncbi:MAG: cation-translocating P-type ATPase [bacterium]